MTPNDEQVQPANILVVDDEAEVRVTIIRQLKTAGYTVQEATSGRTALEVVRGGGIDLVITDVYMPDMDGVELIARMSNEARGIPIVAMSGGGDLDKKSVLGVATHLKVAHTLEKPFDHRQLLDVVRAALESSLASGDSESLTQR